MNRIIFLILINCILLTNLYAQHWQQIGETGPSSHVYSIYGDTMLNKLIIGGLFKNYDSIFVGGLAAWDGFTIHAIGDSLHCSGICASKREMLRYKDHIYFGFYGDDDFVTHDFNTICRWDGINWSNLEGDDLYYSNAHGVANRLSIIDDKLFVTGGFDFANDEPATGIAIWDGENWEGMVIPNLDFAILAGAAKWNDKYYFGGNMTYLFENQAYHDVIEWDGENWYPTGGGILGGLADLRDMIIYKDELYIAGSIKAADGNAGDKILKLQNGEWAQVGNVGKGGGAITDMEIWNNELYVAGPFLFIEDTIPAQYIAKWNGDQWCSLGSTFNNTILSLEVWNDELYIGGGFSVIDGDSIRYIAKWTGGDYVSQCSESVALKAPTLVPKSPLRLYPNPVRGSRLTAECRDWADGPAVVSVYNGVGMRMLQQRSSLSGGKAAVSLPEDLPPGCYTLLLISEKELEIAVQKFIRMR